METTATNISLIQHMQSGDQAAWTRVVQLYGPLIYSWCRKCGLGPEDSADISQEVFRAVVRGIADFRKDQPAGTFRGWLWTITRNKVRDFARSRQRGMEAAGGTDALQSVEQLPDLADDTPEPATGLRSLLLRALDAIRGDFGDDTWKAFVKTTLDGCSSSEVARELGMAANAVRKAKARVLRRLREELGEVA